LRVTVLDFFARWRVRLGYVLAVVVLWLARPTPRSILIGAGIGLIGIWIRAYAAGYLHKQEVLTVTGPYSRTRNPLYFGSSILTLGAAIAMNSWWAGGLLLVYFALVYTFVMRREEMELRQKHGAAFDAYVSAVPLFFPKLLAGSGSSANSTAFSWAQYKKNHEYQAAVGFALLLIGLFAIWWIRSGGFHSSI
jgi:protein-S-isoprenylcysteine O-methyltransferase Ste14